MSQETQWNILSLLYDRWFQNYIVGLNTVAISTSLKKENNEIAIQLDLLQNNGLIGPDNYGGYVITIFGLDLYEENLPPSVISKKKEERKSVLETLLPSYKEDIYNWNPSELIKDQTGISDTYYLLATVVYLENKGLVNLEMLNGGSFYIRLTASGFYSFSDQTADDSIVMSSAYKILFTLENRFRQKIETEMRSKIGSDWWNKGIPSGIKKKVDQLKTDESKLGWKVSNNDKNTNYLMFEHFKGIISTNWEDVFSKIFDDQEKITLKLNELEGIRNSIAHNRTLSNDAMNRLQQYSEDISNLIS